MFSNFDAEFREMNESLLNSFNNDSGYNFNRETGILTYFDGTTLMYKQAPLYRLPDSIIEFCTSVSTINKLHACSLTVNIEELSCMMSGEHDYSLNCLDWVEFAVTDDGIFCVNCNPESPYYEYILMDFVDGNTVIFTRHITHKNITEFVCDMQKWIMLTDQAPDFDPVAYLEYVCPNGYDTYPESHKRFVRISIQARSRYNKSTLCDFASYIFYVVLKN